MASMMQAAMKAQRQWMQQMLGDRDAEAHIPSMIADAATQWQDAVREAAAVGTGEASPLLQQTLERMTEGQSMLMRVFQLVTDAWQEAAERAGEDQAVEDAIEQYAERVDEQLRSANQTWHRAVESQQAMWKKYVDTLQGVGGVPGGIASGLNWPPDDDGEPETPAQAMFESMYRLFEMEAPSERLLDAPGLGLSREFNEKVAQGFKAFQAYQRASVRYRTVTAGIWRDAVQRFLRTLGRRVKDGEPVESMRELTKLWTNVADETFIEAFRTDEYIEAQNDFLEASLRLRKRQRSLTEEVQEALDQPTRSEMEEVYQLLHRLRQENKALKRALNDQMPDKSAAAVEEVEALKAEMQAMADELKRIKDAVRSTGATDDFTAITGIGAARQEELHEAGLLTYRQLADAAPEDIRNALGAAVSADRIANWQRAARDLAA